ncbi:MAG: hypothetical protein AB1349_02845 [Elusimicrobiota bacterium]
MKPIKKTFRFLGCNLSLISFLLSLSFCQDIVFVQPKSLKVTSSPVTIKGSVMDFDTTEIDMAVVNLIDLLKQGKNTPKSKKEKRPWWETLKYETIPVRNGFFQKSIDIKEGINSVIAKPANVQPTSQNTETKVIVLDKVSAKLILTDPVSDRIPYLKKIAGICKVKPRPKSVKVTIEAFVSKDIDGEKKYKLEKLMEVTVPVKSKKFFVPVSLTEMLTGEEILIITISTDDIEITKTLF